MNNNLSLFNKRFPLLAASFNPEEASLLKPFLSKNEMINIQELTDSSLETGIPLHSKYNPLNEAQNIIKSFNPKVHKAAVFYSFGLGWAVSEFCKNFPESDLILIEQNEKYFFSAITHFDWEIIFNHKNLILILGTAENETANLLSKYDEKEICIFKNLNQAKHQEEYIKRISNELLKQKQKTEINTNTLEKFSYLWMKNSCRNLKKLSELDGVNKFFNLGTNIPFVILAAGPSLEKILPHLAEIKKRAILVCVDTALHALLRHNIQPDFIVIVDPQYYCALHLEFLESPESILIGESAVWPDVFRFKCKEKILCSSLFPIGQFFENKLGQKGKLGAGGSVTTTAWDFARKCRAKEIYIAGMDLGFPDLQTHIRGSQFEEKIHRESSRFSSSELANAASLITANPEWKKDYKGNPLLTDKKMSLFSWWFEDACTQAELEGISTYSLNSESLAIKGIKLYALEDFLKKPEISSEKELFFKNAETASNKIHAQQNEINSFEEVYSEFLENLDYLEEQAKKGLSLCEKAVKNSEKLYQLSGLSQELNLIDKNILTSKAKDAASLVFPTQRTLEKLTADIPEASPLKSFLYSKIIYSELLKAIKSFKKNLN